MRRHPAIRILLVAFLTLVLWAPGGAAAGPGLASPTAPLLFHPRFIMNYAGASSTLYLENPLSVEAYAQLEFYTESGVSQYSEFVIIAPHNVRIVAGEDLSALPNGTYSLVVQSTEPLQSVVRTLGTGVPERLVAYRGQSTEMTTLRFGPVHKNTPGLNSFIKVLNAYPVSSQVTITYLSNVGLVADMQILTLPPYGVGTSSNTRLPDGFAGWARITSTGSMVGVLELFDSSANTVMEARGPLGTEDVTGYAPGVVTACVPRVLKHSDQGTGPRSTKLFVGNTVISSATAIVTFYDSGGSAVFTTPDFALPAQGAKTIQLVDLSALPDGAWAACVSGDQPLAIGELTTLDSAGSANETTYDAPTTGSLGQPYGVVLPRLVTDESAHTVFTVQNTGNTAAQATVRLYDLTGSLVYEETVSLASMGWKAYDQSQMPELSAGFAGSGEIASAGPLIAVVDELVSRPAAITDLEASNDTGKVKLDWTEVLLDTSGQSITGVTYNVYRAQGGPYFLPNVTDAAYAPGLTSTTFPDPDATVMTDVVHSTYYVVKAVYQDLLSKPSNRVGVFVFGLVPGSSGVGIAQVHN